MTTHKVILILKRHPERDSGSVRGQGQEKARCEMLKRVQHDIIHFYSFAHSPQLKKHDRKGTHYKLHVSPGACP